MLPPACDLFVPPKAKKPTWENILRCFPTSAYFMTSPPALGQVALHPVIRPIFSDNYTLRGGECKLFSASAQMLKEHLQGELAKLRQEQGE
jgi:hypothetical protein